MFSSLFCDLCFNNNLSQLVSEPTHIGGNILDLILTNKDECIDLLMVQSASLLPFDTDNFSVSYAVNSRWLSSKTSAQYIYDFLKADWLSLSEYLMDFDFTLCLNSSDVEFV